MNRMLVWACAVMVILSAVLTILSPLGGVLNATPSKGQGDPQLLASAISEGLIGIILASPFIIAQLVLGGWAIRQLQKTKSATKNSSNGSSA
ncbi:hypothetical protein [Hyphococcus sp.]|uniref:hypothetical protein n=1 Tax=Hyphococcus sp. TaxID=2038636 RepID=UPI003CCBB236